MLAEACALFGAASVPHLIGKGVMAGCIIDTTISTNINGHRLKDLKKSIDELEERISYGNSKTLDILDVIDGKNSKKEDGKKKESNKEKEDSKDADSSGKSSGKASMSDAEKSLNDKLDKMMANAEETNKKQLDILQKIADKLAS